MKTDYWKWGLIAVIALIAWKEYFSDVSIAAQRTYHAQENFGS